ncbi:MAG: hypothetical protein KAI66_23555 [Lentisphaeria bacterium]|nr:hypothetical protein [Lentisphaeria bacterium]
MELAIYFANIKALLDIDEALRSIDPDKLPGFVNTMMFGSDTSLREYYANLVGLKWIEALQEENEGRQFSRIYFGQEFCEHLIPPPEDLEQAYYYCMQLGWDFTYVTGYVTDAGLETLQKNLTMLSNCHGGEEIEVVVNDWGALRVLRRDFPAMKPVLGRLLHKQKRLARNTTLRSPPPINTDGIKTSEADLRVAQIGAYRDTCMANPAWREELLALGVERADLDMAPQGVVLPSLEEDDRLAFSCYYPWGYVAGGRNCLTAGMIEPAREFLVVDGSCGRPCQHYNKSADLSHYDDPVIQRGNSVFLFHGEYAAAYMQGKFPFSRLVFEPYIPI